MTIGSTQNLSLILSCIIAIIFFKMALQLPFYALTHSGSENGSHKHLRLITGTIEGFETCRNSCEMKVLFTQYFDLRGEVESVSGDCYRIFVKTSEPNAKKYRLYLDHKTNIFSNKIRSKTSSTSSGIVGTPSIEFATIEHSTEMIMLGSLSNIFFGETDVEDLDVTDIYPASMRKEFIEMIKNKYYCLYKLTYEEQIVFTLLFVSVSMMTIGKRSAIVIVTPSVVILTCMAFKNLLETLFPNFTDAMIEFVRNAMLIV